MKPIGLPRSPLVVLALMVGLVFAMVRHQWLYSLKLAPGVTIVQVPFERTYNIHMRKGQVIEDVFGWVRRDGYLYGSYGHISYFLVRLNDWTVVRFDSRWELSAALAAVGLPLYDMSDEENISHLKYGHRKYQ